MNNTPRIMRTSPLTDVMIQRYGDSLNLEYSKAKRLEKNGLVRIIGDYKDKPENKKIIISSRSKRVRGEKDSICRDGLKIPWIIPYVKGGNIGYAYNEAMTNMVEDWVLFTDQDVFMINPMWFNICCDAIEKLGHTAGWITCFTNRIKCKFQIAPGVDKKTNDMMYHHRYAQNLYLKNKGKIKNVTQSRGGKFSGMFILTHKKAWEDAGGFNENIGFFGVDCAYFTKLKKVGYTVHVLQDLYVYHGYFRETLKPFFNKTEVPNGVSKKVC
jgi:GT2 family glycosyltransferase